MKQDLFWANCHQTHLPDNCGTVLGVNWRREVDKQNDEAMPHMDYKNFGYSPKSCIKVSMIVVPFFIHLGSYKFLTYEAWISVPASSNIMYTKSSHSSASNHIIKLDESFWGCIRSQQKKQKMHADIYGISHKYRPTWLGEFVIVASQSKPVP